MVFTLYPYLLVLSLIGAVRIIMKKCPITETAWKARSQMFECKSSLVYHCIQDEEGKLMETCMKSHYINPFYEGGCPWAMHFTDGESVLGGVFHPCKRVGCPQKNDSDYWTNQLYKYPICLHYKQTTEVTASTIPLPTKSTSASDDTHRNSGNKVHTVIAAILVTLMIMMILTLFGWKLLRRLKSHTRDVDEETDVNLRVQLISSDCVKSEDSRNREEFFSTGLHTFCQYEDYFQVKHLTHKAKIGFNIKDSNGRSLLHSAGFSGSVVLVQYLIDIGCDIYSRDNDSRTVAHIACDKGHLNLVQYLIGIDVGILNSRDKKGLTPFHSAGFSRSVELVQYLIDNGCDVYSKDNDGQTIVHNACDKGHISLVKYLLDIDKAVINIKDNNGLTPFHCAGFSGLVELVQYLIDNGCDVYSKDNDGRTIVHNACDKGHDSLVKHLLDIDKNLLHIKDNDGFTPFLCAGFSGSLELAQYLIVNGCDVYSKDNDGRTIVHIACDKGHVNLVKYLIDKDKSLLHMQDNNGLTPFHYAGFSGSVELVQYLIDHGCDVYSKDIDGRTIVHISCQKGHVSLVKHLTNIYKDVVKIKTNKRLTPFYCAGFSGSVELVKYLIDNGCDVYSKDNLGRTIVHIACDREHVSLVRYLIENDKALVKIKANNGLTPFHSAGLSGSVKLVQYLIDNGCDVYSKDNFGRTIVHIACDREHVSLVRYVIEKDKAVVKIKTNNGLTPFHYAGFSGSVELVHYLIDNGCDVRDKDNIGRSIVHIACYRGHVTLVKYLIGIDKSLLNLNDNNGMAPLHCAGFSGSVKLVQYLIDNGCDVYSKDNDGRTIVHYACDKGHASLVKYLIDKDKSLLYMQDNNGYRPFHCAGFSRSVELVQYLNDNGCDVYSKDNTG